MHTKLKVVLQIHLFSLHPIQLFYLVIGNKDFKQAPCTVWRGYYWDERIK